MQCPVCNDVLKTESVRRYEGNGRTRTYWFCKRCNVSIMQPKDLSRT